MNNSISTQLFYHPLAQELLLPVGALLGAVVLGLVLRSVLLRLLGASARETESELQRALWRYGRGPLSLLLPLVLVRILAGFVPLPLPEEALAILREALNVATILALGWTAIRSTSVLKVVVLRRYRLDVQDNLEARKIHTQMDIIIKIIVFLIVLIVVSMVLMSFDGFRSLGTSLLASAGLAGLVLGFAAQRSLGNLLAGIQIALSQPIRIDDVVIVEGEWGRIEEITLTYVVVAIWDKRRMILPISYFIEQPFQNWTRSTAEILGTVFFYVDYTVSVDVLREELHRILKESRYWDGKGWALQVTNATDRALELRALMSAPNSPDAWELRCEVREKLLAFIQREYPESLPRIRAEAQMSDSR